MLPEPTSLFLLHISTLSSYLSKSIKRTQDLETKRLSTIILKKVKPIVLPRRLLNQQTFSKHLLNPSQSLH
jgi:hypothetical protein